MKKKKVIKMSSFNATLIYASVVAEEVGAPKNENEEFDVGNRIVLPPELLEPLLLQDLRPAMNLVLTSRATMLRCYVGVKEFSAPPGRIILPKSVVEALGLSGSTEKTSEIIIRVGKARAATQLALRSLNSLGDVNIEAFLTEAIPRQYVVVQKGQVLKFTYDGDEEAIFIVTDFKPEGVEAVMLVDTNVALDVEPYSGISSSPLSTTVVPLRIETELICTSAASYYSVLLSDVSTSAVKVTIRSEIAIPEVYLSFNVKRPKMADNGWIIPGRRVKGGNTSMVLLPDAASFPEDSDSFNMSNVLYLAATSKGAINEQIKFSLLVETIELEQTSSSGTVLPVVSKTTQPDANMQLCLNCRANVPTSSFSLHSLSCSRNNFRCEHLSCGAILRKGTEEAINHHHCKDCSKVIVPDNQERHTDLWHTLHTCENGCGKKSSLHDLHYHSRFECRYRKILCRFCNLLVRAGPIASSLEDRERGLLSSHEADVCGVRTKICTLCTPKRAVALKLFDDHLTKNHPTAIAARSSAHEMTDTSELGISFNPENQWRCKICTVVNEMKHRNCSVCGSEDNDRLGSVASEPSPVAIGNQSVGMSNVEDSIMASSSAPTSRPCANEPCGARVVINFSEPRSIPRSLCARCYSLVCTPPASSAATSEFYSSAGGQMGEDDDALNSQIMRALQIRYGLQIDLGCGNALCRNAEYCATARRHSTFNKETELAQLLSESVDSRFHVCVTDNAKFIPTVPVPSVSSFASIAPIAKKAAVGKKTIGAAFFP